jgi:protein SCO1
VRNLVLILALVFSFVGSATWAARGPLPNVALVNQEGKPFQLHDLKGKYLLVSFIYSRCPMPKMCPLTMRLVKRTLTAWKKELPDKPVHALTVTLDPKTDTPKVLKSYGKTHGANFKDSTLATGNEKVLEDFASEFNVIGVPEGGGHIGHNMKTVLVGPDLVPLQDFKENEWKPEDIVAAAKKLASGR